MAGPCYKPIFAYNLNESTSGVGKLTEDRMMVAVSAMMGLSISNKTCLSPCSTTFVKSRSILSMSLLPNENEKKSFGVHLTWLEKVFIHDPIKVLCKRVLKCYHNYLTDLFFVLYFSKNTRS